MRGKCDTSAFWLGPSCELDVVGLHDAGIGACAPAMLLPFAFVCPLKMAALDLAEDALVERRMAKFLQAAVAIGCLRVDDFHCSIPLEASGKATLIVAAGVDGASIGPMPDDESGDD